MFRQGEGIAVSYFITIAVGFVLTNVGFWVNNEKESPAAQWGLVAIFAGLSLTFGGILLSSVPDFFAS